MKSKRRRRPRTPRSSSFQFAQLESRQMLASLPTTADLIINSSFDPVTESQTTFYQPNEVDGWSVSDVANGQTFNLFKIQGDHGFVLNLDSTADQFDSIFQDINTRSGNEYVLSFELRNRPVDDQADPVTNDIEVLWDGQSLGVYRATQRWQTVVLKVAGGDADTTRLEFREISEPGSVGGDGRGPLIDNVHLANVTDNGLDNGGFESVGDTALELHASSDISGWGAMGLQREDRLLQIVNGSDGSEGERYLDLDSSDTRIDRVYRFVDTQPGMSYFISFDIRSASGEVDDNNELRVRWNNQWAGTFYGDSDWRTYGVFVTADSDLTLLVFREPNSVGDGIGPYLDNIQIFEVDPVAKLVSVDTNGPGQGLDSSVQYDENAGPQAITTSELTVINKFENAIDQATIIIDNLFDNDQEILSVDTQGTSISAAFDSSAGTLTLSGTDTVERYQDVLRTLTYENTSESPTEVDRNIRIAVMHDSLNSPAATITVQVNSINDAPLIPEIVGDQAVSLGETYRLDIKAKDVDGDSLDYFIESSGLPIGGESSRPEISDSGIVTWTPEREGELSVTVAVADPSGEIDAQTFTIVANRDGAVPADFEPFSGNRDLSFVNPASRNNIYSEAPVFNLDASKDYEAIFSTADGEIHVRLLLDTAPLAVNNFVNLARDGFYDGLTFQRVVSLGPGFIAQGGDPLSTNGGGPGYRFNDDATGLGNFDVRDLLAMANSGPNTNGSQFFFTLSPQVHLNGRHVIFGEVIAGSDVVDAINRREVNSSTPAEIIYSVEIVESDPAA